MDPEPERLIDIDELALQAGRRLEELGVAQANGQVTARPDIRTLRWYTTVGLLDPPAERRGRRAFYGRHHVAQVVAVKRLQAEGASLTDISARLAGLSTAALEAMADDPAPPVGPTARTVDGAGVSDAGPGGSDVGPGGDLAGTDGPAGPDGSRGSRSAAAPAPARSAGAGGDAFWSAVPVPRSVGVAGLLAGVALDPTTSVTFAAPRPLTDADVESLRRAARPLLDELRRRGLVPVPMHVTDLTDLAKDRLP